MLIDGLYRIGSEQGPGENRLYSLMKLPVLQKTEHFLNKPMAV
jgi:hypothetical protein